MPNPPKGSCEICQTPIPVRKRLCGSDQCVAERGRRDRRAKFLGDLRDYSSPMLKFPAINLGVDSTIGEFVLSLLARLNQVYSNGESYINRADCSMYAHGLFDWFKRDTCEFVRCFKHLYSGTAKTHSDLPLSLAYHAAKLWYNSILCNRESDYADCLMALFTYQLVIRHLYGGESYGLKRPYVALEGVFENSNDKHRYKLDLDRSDKKDFTERTGQSLLKCIVPNGCRLDATVIELEGPMSQKTFSPGDWFHFYVTRCPLSEGLHDSSSSRLEEPEVFCHELVGTDIAGNIICEEVAKRIRPNEHVYYLGEVSPRSEVKLRWVAEIDGRPVGWREKFEDALSGFFDHIDTKRERC
jgi:hypothetical protein